MKFISIHVVNKRAQKEREKNDFRQIERFPKQDALWLTPLKFY
jgi:hypothetical protein